MPDAQPDKQPWAGRDGLMRRALWVTLLAVVLLAADRVTKDVAERTLAPGRRIPVLGDALGLRILHNPGASLGLGAGHTWVISLASAAACVALAYGALRVASRLWAGAFTFAFAGALGNLIDRVANATGFLDGTVTDFIDYGWSVGNVADIWLVGAACAVIVLIVADVPMDGGRRKAAGDAAREAAASKAADKAGAAKEGDAR